MTRRIWLLNLLAAPLLRAFPRAQATKLGRDIIEALSLHPQAKTLRWTRTVWSGYKRAFGYETWAGQLMAKRSDGTLFYVTSAKPPGWQGYVSPAPPPECEAKMEEFRTCRCRVGKPCLKHELERA